MATWLCEAPGCVKKDCRMRCPTCAEQVSRLERSRNWKCSLGGYFCSQDCFEESWHTHKDVHVYMQERVQSSPEDDKRAAEVLRYIREAGHQRLRTPNTTQEASDEPVDYASVKKREASTWGPILRNCGFRIETKRMIMRPVEPKDLDAIRTIKTEPSVNRQQMYGRPNPAHVKEVFLESYIRSRIPYGGLTHGALSSFRWAITVKTATVVPHEKHPGGEPLRNAPLPHTDDAYVGNIGADVACTGDFAMTRRTPACLRPSSNGIFTWPNPSELADLDASIFYEIHPLYWNKGLVTEALLAVVDFFLTEYGIIIDPKVSNEASIGVARKIPDMSYLRTKEAMRSSEEQFEFVVTRRDWVARFGLPAVPAEAVTGSLVTPSSMNGLGGKELCIWCMNLRQGEARLACDRCKIAKYCSNACRTAHWDWPSTPHQTRCRARGAEQCG